MGPNPWFIPVCRECGKRGTQQVGGHSQTGAKPIKTPIVGGRCPNTQNGKHNPKWELYRW